MAAAFAPKASQILMTPDPHYIPGYAGYCPHYKFTLGQSYGKLTSQLLASPEVARSGRLLLQPNRCHPCDSAQLPEPKEQERGGAKTHLLGYGMIPGYTGFIPRAQNHFAKTYSEICKEARNEFARQLAGGMAGRRKQGRWHGAKAESPKDPETESERLTAKFKAPLEAVSAAAAPYVSRDAFKAQGSPYSMDDSSPQKYFISGFTGFIPRARSLIGASYPVITRRALVEFGQMLQRDGRASSRSSMETPGSSKVFPPLAKTYPTDEGLMPHYKGHVPGYKFQFGHTYGHLTYNALGQSTLEKQMADVAP